MATIAELVSGIEDEIITNKEHQDRLANELATAEKNDPRYVAMFRDLEHARAAQRRLNAKLANARQIEKEEAETDAKSREVHVNPGLPQAHFTREGKPAYDQVARIGEEPHTYSRDRDPQGQGRQFMLDVARGTLFGEAEAQQRLQRHQHEMRVDRHGSGAMEYRTDSYADTSDFPGLIIPEYLTNLYQPLAANARPLANAMRHERLGSEGMHVELATGATGVSVVVNPGELSTPTPVGNFSVAPLELDVNTIQTYATVSRQAIERGRTENVLLQNMYSAMAAALDNELLYQTTNGLHTVATRVEWDEVSPTGAKLYPKLIARKSSQIL